MESILSPKSLPRAPRRWEYAVTAPTDARAVSLPADGAQPPQSARSPSAPLLHHIAHRGSWGAEVCVCVNDVV